MAKGVRDVDPEDKILKNQVITNLKSVFELFGFTPLETPIIERYETLGAKFAAGEESDALKETFRLVDQGNRKLGLRFDLTVPLSRYVAMNPSMKMPFKRYEVGRVFRDGPIRLGRAREFWQMDIDTVGTDSMLADAEIIAMVDAAFNKLGLNVVVKINNRKLLNGILDQAGFKKDKEQAIISIDKLEKIGKPAVEKELLERGYTKSQIKNLFSMISDGVSLKELKKKIITSDGKEGLQELEEVFTYLKWMGIKTAKFDVSLARGLAYYTGTVFEAYLKKGKVTSSLAGGGRYDRMIGDFLGGGRIIPAMGISFGLEPIMATLREIKKTVVKTPAQVYILPIGTVKESLKVASKLREAEIATDFAIGKKGVSKNLQYANSLEIPYVILIGEKELSTDSVTVRDMKTGLESKIKISKLVTYLKKQIQ